jgi:hypothetical protein
MTHKSANGKARRLQVLAAELLSIHCDLSIEACPPTKPGIRATGARYLPEGSQPDLRVRMMGQPGADVALISDKAKAQARFRDGNPFWIECKNTEKWGLESTFWERSVLPEFMQDALAQAEQGSQAAGGGSTPLVVLAKNHWTPMALWRPTDLQRALLQSTGAVWITGGPWALMPYGHLIEWMAQFGHEADGWTHA